MSHAKVVCPKNPQHKRFTVTAHVAELWVVDENMDWQETVPDEAEVVHHPDGGDVFTCETCGTTARVKREG